MCFDGLGFAACLEGLVSFKRYDQEQGQLFPPRVGDFVDDDHIARAVSDIVDRFGLSAIEVEYSELGQHAFSPRMMLKIRLYGLIVGILSSRRLAQSCCENVVFMWLAGGHRPDFRTIALFLQRHREALGGLHAETVRIAIEMGVLSNRAVAIDGTRVRANANLSRSATIETLESERANLKAESEALIARALAADAAEDDAGNSDDDHRMPPELRSKQARIERLDRAIAAIESKPSRTKANRTDPDAPIMKRRGEKAEVAYNAQLAVDVDSHLIVAADVTTDATDNAQLVPMLDQAIDIVGEAPEEVLADAGYTGIANVEAVRERGCEPLIAQRDARPKGSRALGHEDFTYDEETDAYICPEGERLEFWKRGKVTGKSGAYPSKSYKRDDCGDCHRARDCLREGQRGRSMRVADTDRDYQAMKNRLRTPQGKTRYGKRKSTVEPAIGRLKSMIGLRQFLTRGLKNVQAELKLAITALNITRLAHLLKSTATTA